MRGIKDRNKAVQEPTALSWRLCKNLIHCWGQPNRTDVLRQGRHTFNGLTIDMNGATVRSCSLNTRSEPGRSGGRFDFS
jgi:hypothetical protein